MPRSSRAGNPSGPIRVQELTADGLAFRGPPSEVLRNDLDWEGRLVEAPSVVKRRGRYYLFYSGGAYDTPGYALGVARSTSPTGPFEKRGEPILRTGKRWQGPGHNCIVTLEDSDYILYHAWEGARFRDVRPCLLDRVTWGDEGWPAINDGRPSEG
jgi:beta-xylosidase